jgi:hypothetical protein
MAMHHELSGVAPHTIHGTDQLVRAWCLEADDLDARSMPGWSAFVARWMAFNALYNLLDRQVELDRVKLAVDAFLEPNDCADILERVRKQLAFLSSKPPGDDRLDSSDAEYRQQSSSDLRIAGDSSKEPRLRLRSLFAVAYLIRCNLVHGNKHPEWSRDRELVQCCSEILQVAVPRMRIW